MLSADDFFPVLWENIPAVHDFLALLGRQQDLMLKISGALPKTIAVIRIATSVFFLLFGQYKVFGSEFTHGGFQQYLQSFIQNSAVSFYQPILADLVLPHAVFFGYLVGLVELFIGVCLLVGIWVRPASVLGALHMVSLTLATWWGPGPGMPVWRYFGSELDHLPLLFLFAIFFVADAGQEWGLDGHGRGRPGSRGPG
jgi:thiosulfate dehydrogenase (quinone) large subunit